MLNDTRNDGLNEKDQLRRALRARRRQFVADTPSCTLRLHAVVIARIALHAAGEAKSVAAYLSDGREVDPLPALEFASALGLRTALPHVDKRGGAMRFLAWEPGQRLVDGPYGVPQPSLLAPEVEPEVILAPLVGFDRKGHRLGQGGGFYDRAFEAHPDARRIGLAWSVQEVDAVPVDPWDQPLHSIVTERERIDF